jgi:hypothetical protein
MQCTDAQSSKFHNKHFGTFGSALAYQNALADRRYGPAQELPGRVTAASRSCRPATDARRAVLACQCCCRLVGHCRSHKHIGTHMCERVRVKGVDGWIG